MSIKDFFQKIISFFKKPKQVETPEKLATAIIVMMGDTAIGAIQNLSITENRVVKKLDNGLGTASSTAISLTTGHARLVKSRLVEVFQRGQVNAASQKYDLTIVIKDNKTITKIEHVWITSVGLSYESGEWILIDEMKLEAEKIETINGSNTL